MNTILLFWIIRNIRRHFGFLLQKGYVIKRADYDFKHFGNWRVVLESVNCLVEIYQDRDEILLAFAPKNGSQEYLIGIEPMVYFLSNGKTFIGWYCQHPNFSTI